MRKLLYCLISASIFLGVFGFLEIQQLKGSDIEFSDINYLKKVILKQRPLTPFDDMDKRNSARKSDIMEIAFALNNYKKDNGKFPGKLEVCGSLTRTGIFSSDAKLNPLYPEYIKILPEDPVNNSLFNYIHIGDGGKFILFAKLENREDGKKIYYCIDSITSVPVIIDFNPSQKMVCK